MRELQWWRTTMLPLRLERRTRTNLPIQVTSVFVSLSGLVLIVSISPRSFLQLASNFYPFTDCVVFRPLSPCYLPRLVLQHLYQQFLPKQHLGSQLSIISPPS